ncbi:MAG: ATP-binding protein [Candidatus Omnitrophica bacterium]|nr:ATP-binding protein [Candidatus Omnitrophota bacterium]
MNFYAVLPIVTGIIIFIIGLFVFSRNRKSSINIVFSIFSLIVVIWLFCYSLMYLSKDSATALLWARAGFLAIIFIPILTYHFIVVFLNLKDRRFLFAIYLLALPAVLLSYSDYIYSGILMRPWGYYPTAGKFYCLFLLMFVVIFVKGLWLLYAQYRKEQGTRREQIKYVAFGFLLGTLGGVDYLVKYPPFYNIYPFGYICAFVFYCIITYSILKYRLMDINVVLTRAGIFVVVYALVLGIPFWLGYETNSWFFPTFLAILLASVGPFIYNYIRRRAENILLKEQRRYHNTLRQLSATLTLIKDLDRLLKIIVYRVAKTVKVQFASAYLFKDNKFSRKSFYVKSGGAIPDLPLELPFESGIIAYINKKHSPVFLEEMDPAFQSGFKLKNSLIIPSFMRGKLLGFLLLGPKLSGTVYTKDDASVFEILANQAALAIENTEFIDESQKTQAQLFAAERMASMGAMAGGMSHQINNRFHAIIMATSDSIDAQNFIDLNSFPQEAKDYFGQVKHALGRIQENAKHGGKIVNDFLNFSQPDRLQKQAREFNLMEPLLRAIEMVRIKTAFPQDTIDIAQANGIPGIQGDFVLLQDVFFNLIDNAVDAIKTKEQAAAAGYKGKITVEMSQKDSKIITIVRDNGTGISEESLKKVFVPFFTTKATSTKGTGLGLFVIQKIINAHQGDIKLESKFGEGTTFIITLPISQKETR